MRLVSLKNRVGKEKLQVMAKSMFGNLVKAVVDVEKEVMVSKLVS